MSAGYLTGKTNSLVSAYSFKTLEDYINILSKQKPLWLKIKNPIKCSSFSGYEVYGPNQDSKIIFFNPFDEKEKNSRIYLEFLAINSYVGNRENFIKLFMFLHVNMVFSKKFLNQQTKTLIILFLFLNHLK